MELFNQNFFLDFQLLDDLFLLPSLLHFLLPVDVILVLYMLNEFFLLASSSLKCFLPLLFHPSSDAFLLLNYFYLLYFVLFSYFNLESLSHFFLLLDLLFLINFDLFLNFFVLFLHY